eukprot:SM000078S22069  [mRNA]  locus=s78:271500:274287:- [translate_table: standard]
MLWVDKHRPRTLDKATIVHAAEARHLKSLAASGDCPHLLFYGPSGAGKKTLIAALLREMYGPAAEKVKVENTTWKIEVSRQFVSATRARHGRAQTSAIGCNEAAGRSRLALPPSAAGMKHGSRQLMPGSGGGGGVCGGTRKLEIELTAVSSNHHVELTPSDAGYQDRYVVQEVIKEMAKSRPLDVVGNRQVKVLVLNEVDRLSKEAQHSLRRTMEKYSAACRLVLCCNSASKVIEAVRSRCLNVRVAAPTLDEIAAVLQHVAKKEGLSLPPVLAARIAVASNRNLRRAILSLEACKVKQYPFSDKQPVQTTDWEAYIAEIASDIFGEQSPKRLFMVRGKFYELLVNCIPAEVILKVRLLCRLQLHCQAFLATYSCFSTPSCEVKLRTTKAVLRYISNARKHAGAGCLAAALSRFSCRTWIDMQRLTLELIKKLDAELKHEVCHWAAFYVRPHLSILSLPMPPSSPPSPRTSLVHPCCPAPLPCSCLHPRSTLTVVAPTWDLLFDTLEAQLIVCASPCALGMLAQEHRMQLGQKAIFHLEAFAAKFMSIYKKFLIATFG